MNYCKQIDDIDSEINVIERKLKSLRKKRREVCRKWRAEGIVLLPDGNMVDKEGNYVPFLHECLK